LNIIDLFNRIGEKWCSMEKNNLNKQNLLNLKQLFSGLLDYLLVFSVLQFVLVRFFAFLFTPLSFICVAFTAFILTSLVEAFLLTTWGKTIGGAILGIEIKDKVTSKKLSLKQALSKMFFFSSSHKIVTTPSPFFMKWGGVLVIAASSWLGFNESFFSLKKPVVSSIEHITVEGWKTFHSDEIGFAVDFPTDPYKLENTLDLPGRRSVIFQEIKSLKEQIAYSVSYLHIPKKWLMFRSSTILNGALKVLTDAQYNSEVVQKQVVSHRKYPALDFYIKQGDEILKGRLILVGSTLYRVMITQPKADEFSSDLQLFVDSFEPVEKKTALS